ncbi:uncharacterized protein METZ01_LOCUS5826 [marine metagenome]|uniref:Tetratricopeptide repeat protein n=1 Tax=marine metagenome TaxID=408172 RepID=A0A381NEJ2_9ZZZZ
MSRRTVWTFLVASLLSLGTAGSTEAQQTTTLGTIDFPVSATSAEAKEHFLKGAMMLHSFEWEDAAEAFQAAQQIEPDFAMAYWGEALSHTTGHHFPAGQNLAAAREVLSRLAETREERAAKAPTAREKAYLAAVEALYGPGDAQERALAYSEAMGQMHQNYPDDFEAATFYALSLMRSVRRGEGSIRQDMQAGAIAQTVLRQNENHPGAAHYTIHAYDDPIHSPIGLHAALTYADIAPAAVHALHMPSHIFVQQGMWDYLARSNKASWDASVARVDARGEPPTRYSYHALYWLQYAYLQQGLRDKATETLALIRPIAEREDGRRVRSTYAIMDARYTIATRQWRRNPGLAELVDRITVDPSEVRSHEAGAVLLAAGLSAAHLNDITEAQLALRGLRELHDYLSNMGDDNQSVTQVAVILNEVEGMVHFAQGNHDSAIESLAKAASIEETMVAPSGPPGESPTDGPIKPSHELYGELLLELDRPGEATEQFAKALLRTPHRPLSLLGSARAAAGSGDAKTARSRYAELETIWAGSAGQERALNEAHRYLEQAEEQ